MKEDAVLSIDGAGSSFSALFLIFGVFIVVAGLLLIVNLWIMSADDRSKEWGLLRSIGASSQDIEWILRIEGVMLSTPACFLGSFLGMFLAGLLMGGLGAFFQATFGVGFSFYWTFQSILRFWHSFFGHSHNMSNGFSYISRMLFAFPNIYVYKYTHGHQRT